MRDDLWDILLSILVSNECSFGSILSDLEGKKTGERRTSCLSAAFLSFDKRVELTPTNFLLPSSCPCTHVFAYLNRYNKSLSPPGMGH